MCGYSTAHADFNTSVQIPMDVGKRDVLNGFGLGCSTLCFIWFFMESVIFALAAHDPARWSVYGPILSVAAPLIAGLLMYLLLNRRPSGFSRGLGFSLLVTLMFAVVFAYVGTRYHDSKPAANGSNGFE